MSLLRRAVSEFLVDASSPLFPFAIRYAWTIPVVAVLGFLASGLEGIGIGLLIPLLSVGFGDSAGGPASGVLGALMRLPLLLDAPLRLPAIVAAILALSVLKGAVQWANTFFIAWIDATMSHEIRCELARQLLTVGYPFFHDHDPGRLLTIISSDSWRASDTIRQFYSMVSAFGAVAVFAVLLFVASWQLFLLVAIGSLVIRMLQGASGAQLKRRSRRFADGNIVLGDRMLRVSNDIIRTVRLFGQEAREQQMFDAASGEVRHASIDVARSSSFFSVLLEFSMSILLIVVLVVAVYTQMSVPVLVAFLAILYRMQPHAYIIGRARIQIASLRASVEEVEWLLDPADKPRPAGGTLALDKVRNQIRFSGVSFRYENRPSTSPAVDGVTFDIRANVATALLGRSGAGKSTIVNLLCRLTEPSEGKILVDGVDLSQIDPRQWRSGVAIAGQDVDLVEGTIADNIAYGAPDATIEELVEAARRADAHDFVSGLKNGYQTMVGSRGLSLSGGQRQRIGIARALVRKPHILILDEATNSVDAVSEAAIMALLDQRDSDMTLIVISHRESTLALCEDAVVLENGRVVEWGPARSLKNRKAVHGALDD